MSETDAYPGFAPPVAVLASSDPAPAPVPFFLVGTRKLVVLTIVTLGVYQLYWFYMHWRRLQQFGNEDVWPIVRAAFGGLFCYWLFARVNDEADAQGTPTMLSAGLLTVVYFVGVTAVRLGAPFWLALGLTALPLALTQSIVNRLPQVTSLSKGERNVRLSKKNWALVALFALFVLVLLLPEPDVTTASSQ
jgi:cell division protein FtsW (lipid II flippase)